jgi:hypothetical protein
MLRVISLFPRSGVSAHWGIEAFEAYFADILEQESFAKA